MKQSTKSTLIIAGLTVLSGVALFGTTAGSLAWYAYSTNVAISFTGTSVSKSELIHIGIVDDNNYISDETIEEYNLTKSHAASDDKTIVWTSTSTALDSFVLKEYLQNAGYAYNELSPVSSHSREIDDDLTLYRAPDFSETEINELALKKNYIVLPFAFKIIDSEGELVQDKEIWLTDADTQTEALNIDEAIRIFVKNSQEQFLMNPSVKDPASGVGATAVGGLLDLDENLVYDYDVNNDREYIYGEYTGSPSYSMNNYGDDASFDEEAFDNVNNTKYNTEASTFYSKHSSDAKSLDLSGVTFKEAKYETFGTVKPLVQPDGTLYAGATGKPIAYTDSADKFGYATLTIYLEGWDHSVITKAVGYEFNLGLTFQINRVR